MLQIEGHLFFCGCRASITHGMAFEEESLDLCGVGDIALRGDVRNCGGGKSRERSYDVLQGDQETSVKNFNGPLLQRLLDRRQMLVHP